VDDCASSFVTVAGALRLALRLGLREHKGAGSTRHQLSGNLQKCESVDDQDT
jgi:hypothetical protein